MACTPRGDPAEPRKGADWNRAADGIGMAGVAVFFLLNTTGVVPWAFWLEAIPLWPLLIVSAGVKMTFERTRMPWMVLLGPAIVLGGLAWVANGATIDASTGSWKAEGPLPRPEGAARVKLDLDLVASRLTVEGRALDEGAIADARSIERGEKTRLAVSRHDDVATLRLDSRQKGGLVWLPGRRERWQLGVSQDLPVALDLHGAMVRSRFDLATSRVTGGAIDGAFLATTLTLPPVEETVKIHLNGAFNMLRLSVPKGTTVRVRGTGFPFNLLKRRVIGDPQKPGYEVQLDGIFSAIAVDVRPLPKPSPAPPAEAPPAEADAAKPADGRPALAGTAEAPPAKATPSATRPGPKPETSPVPVASPPASPAGHRG